MSAWPKVTLGELCDIRIGRTPSRKETEYWGPGHPWATISDLNQGHMFSATRETISDKGASIMPPKVPAGTVLMSFKLSLGKTARAAIDTYTNEAIVALPIRDINRLIPEFLDLALHTVRWEDFANRAAKGSTLNRASLQSVPIPVPPIDEQHRITEVLSPATATAAAFTTRATALSSLKSAYFHRVADRATAKLPLSDLVSIRAGSSLPNGEAFAGQLGGSLLLRVSDLNHSQNARQVSVASRWHSDEADRSTSAPAGSVVFPKRGGAIGTNKKRVLRRAAQLDPNLMGLVPRDEQCPTEWLAAWLDTIDLGTLANGSSVPQINKKDVKDLQVPVPSTEDVRLFRQLSQNVERLQNVVQQQIDSAQELYDSLNYRAFRGEL